MKAYHGTSASFDVFDPYRSETEFGCFFTTSPALATEYAETCSGRIIEAEITIKNPFSCTMSEWTAGSSPDPQVVAEGGIHDGYVIEGIDGASTIIVWDPATIRASIFCVSGSDLFAELVRQRNCQQGEDYLPTMGLT